MQRLRGAFLTWLSLAGMLAVLVAAAPVAAQTAGWQAGPGAVLDNTYDGYIDTPAGGATVSSGGLTVAGWFVDKTAQGWAGADDVQIWLGAMDGGGRMLAKALFAQNRPDVAAATGNPYWAASGFSAGIGGGQVPTGQQTLSVYAHTPAKGWWFKQVQVNVSTSAPAAAAPTVSGAGLPIVGIEKPADGEKVLTNNEYEIIGFALDPAAGPNQGVAGSGIDGVSVYLGPREEGGTFLGDAELGFSSSAAAAYGAQFASGGWRLRFKPTQFHANTYLLVAYAHSAVSGKEDSITRFFAIREQ
jgi:hypothetical protein